MLGHWNDVRGSGGWFYGLRVHEPHGVVEFWVYRGTEALGPLRASAYRTTTLARKMGERKLRGYEHVALEAIREHKRARRCERERSTT